MASSIFVYRARVWFEDGEAFSFTTITDRQLSETAKLDICNCLTQGMQGVSVSLDEHTESLSQEPFISLSEQLRAIVARHRPECIVGSDAARANAQTDRSKPGKRRGMKAV